MFSPESEIEITIIASVFITLLAGTWIVSFTFLFQKKQHINKQKILQTELEVKEQTLKVISEIIHDDIGQKLSIAILHLSAINNSKVEHALDLVDESMKGLRNLSKILNPDVVCDSILTELIRFELERINSTSVFQTILSIQGNEKRLTHVKQLPIFRIFQECISNVVKHSKALNIEVEIIFDFDKLSMKIKDDGVGFDSSLIREKEFEKRGSGLKNLKANASRIQGELLINSEIGKGTCITLHTLI